MDKELASHSDSTLSVSAECTVDVSLAPSYTVVLGSNGLSVRRTERSTSERCGLFQGPSRSERACLSPGCQVLQSLSFTVSCLAAVPLEAQTAGTQRLLRSGTSIWRPHPGVDRTPLSKPGHNPSLLGAVGHAGSEPDLSAFYN